MTSETAARGRGADQVTLMQRAHRWKEANFLSWLKQEALAPGAVLCYAVHRPHLLAAAEGLFTRRKSCTTHEPPFLRAQTDGPVAQNPVRVPRRGRAQRPRRQGLLQDQTRSSAPPVCHLFGRSGHFGACTARALPLSLLLFPLCAGASGMLCCPATSSARGRSVWSCSGLFPCAWLWGSCLWRREPCPPAQRIACGSREHANSSLADSQQAPAR